MLYPGLAVIVYAWPAPEFTVVTPAGAMLPLAPADAVMLYVSVEPATETLSMAMLGRLPAPVLSRLTQRIWTTDWLLHAAGSVMDLACTFWPVVVDPVCVTVLLK